MPAQPLLKLKFIKNLYLLSKNRNCMREDETLKVQTALSFTVKSLPSLLAVELKNDANQQPVFSQPSIKLISLTSFYNVSGNG